MDTASTSDAVTFITYVQSLKRKIKQFEKQVEVSSRSREVLTVCPGSPALWGHFSGAPADPCVITTDVLMSVQTWAPRASVI